MVGPLLDFAAYACGSGFNDDLVGLEPFQTAPTDAAFVLWGVVDFPDGLTAWQFASVTGFNAATRCHGSDKAELSWGRHGDSLRGWASNLAIRAASKMMATPGTPVHRVSRPSCMRKLAILIVFGRFPYRTVGFFKIYNCFVQNNPHTG